MKFVQFVAPPLTHRVRPLLCRGPQDEPVRDRRSLTLPRLEAVKQNGYVIVFVKIQTNEICLEAVKQNVHVLKYVKNKTEEICAAVQTS